MPLRSDQNLQRRRSLHVYIIMQCEQILTKTILDQDFTLTAQLSVYCSRRWERVIYQTIFTLGSMIGLITMNMVADTRGRRISTLLSTLISMFGVFLTILGGMTHSVFLLILSQLFLGFSGFSLFVLVYILLTDFCYDTLRQKGIVYVNACWGFAVVLMGICYLVQLTWQNFLLLCLLLPICLLFIIFYFLLEETPYILMMHNKKQQCLQMFIRLCQYNKRQDKIDEIKMLIYRKESLPVKEQQVSYVSKVCSILQKWKHFKVILLISGIYGIGKIMYFGIEFALQDQGYNYGINSIIIGGVESLTYYYLNNYVDRINRTKGIAFFYALTVLLGFLFLIPSVQHSKFISSVLIGLGRFFFTFGYTLIVCLETQSFPVEIQSTAAGAIQAISLMGVVVSPAIVSYSMSSGVNPIFVISIVLLLGMIPCKYIRQTSKNKKGQLFSPLKSQTTITSIQLVSVGSFSSQAQ